MLHVRFDEQRLETGLAVRIEAPALPDNSYSPQRLLTAPVADSTDRRVAVVDAAYQRLPALETAIDCLGARRAVGHFQAMNDEPLVQDISARSGALRAQPRAADCIEVMLACLALDFVEFPEQVQRFGSECTAMVGVEFIELAPGVLLMPSVGY